MTSPFGPRTTLALVVFGSLSLATALVLVLLGGAGAPTGSAGSDAYSRSALGHRAFVDLLRARSVPVVVSRHDSGRRAGESLLVALEPDPARLEGEHGAESLSRMVERSAATLLVLPKRAGEPDEWRPSWIARSWTRPTRDADRVLAGAGLTTGVFRLASAATGWTGSLAGAPSIAEPQLLPLGSVDPWLASEEGVLVGEAGGIVVVSDPDLFANHGLARGDNARIAVALVERLREGSRTVVVDETLHGHRAAPGIARELLRPPLVLVLVQAACLLAVLLWAGVGRFGEPVPAPVALAAGKTLLVQNAAALLRVGGHSARVVERYLRRTVQDVVRAAHAPPDLSPQRVREVLAQVAASRGVEDDPSALEAEVRALAGERGGRGPRALALAARIHQWGEEMTHGRSRHPGG